MGSSVVDVGPRLAVALAVLAAVAGLLGRRGEVEARAGPGPSGMRLGGGSWRPW
jgi:hypothetical protein